jgi:transposase
MTGKRFKQLGMDSFFGSYVYERVVPRDHFLFKLNQVIDWEPFTELLLVAYQGQAETGRPPYPPVVILKMLVISYLYGFSERQVEEATNFNLAIKEFVGLAVDERAPDHSTLSEFNRRLRATGAGGGHPVGHNPGGRQRAHGG